MSGALRRQPSRGAVRWARRALSACGHTEATGYVELDSQRELARRMELSPGTVNRHISRLGGIVVSTSPLVLDAGALDEWRPRQHLRAHRPVAALSGAARVDTTATADGVVDSAAVVALGEDDTVAECLEDLVETALRLAAISRRPRLISIVNDFIDDITEELETGSVDDRATFWTPDRATPRDVFDDKTSRGVARRRASSLTDEVSQSDLFPDRSEDSDCLTVSGGARHRAPSTEPKTSRGSQDVARPEDYQLSEDQVRDIVGPLAEECRRRNIDGGFDGVGMGWLRTLSVEDLTYGSNKVRIQVRNGAALKRPVGVIIKAVKLNDRSFFTDPTPAAGVPKPPVVSELVDVDEAADSDDDPLEGLSPEQLAEIDAQVPAHLTNETARQAIRKDKARELLRRKDGPE